MKSSELTTPSEPASDSATPHDRSALISAVAAFTVWGLVPVYWKLLRPVPAFEILAHRCVWTTTFLVGWLTWQRRWPEVLATIRSRRALIYCLTSGLAISINWLLFIWAVNAGRIIETSLGYFMTPLMNVVFGAVFLRERLTRWQVISVILAALGVANLAFGYGKLPWIAITLCTSWGIYGLLRKKSGTRAIPGLFVETTLLAPFAIVFLFILAHRGGMMFGLSHLSLSAILVTTGVVTGLPLVWFGHAARHLRMTTLGFLQYLAPSGSFLLGVFVYHETFTRAHLLTFLLIWTALAIFTAEAILRWRSGRARSAVAIAVTNSAI